MKLCMWHRHVRARRAWGCLGRPVSCAEMAAAVCRHAPDAGVARARMLALGRWTPGTIYQALARCGMLSTRARLSNAPHERAHYAKLRKHGFGADEALRELGL